MTQQPWVADPRISWRPVLTASLPQPVDRTALTARLAVLSAAQNWASTVVEDGEDVSALRSLLISSSRLPLRVGVHGPHVVLSAHHSHLDGLGLLAALSRLSGSELRSSARGVADRGSTGGLLRTVASRLAEVLFHPPALIRPLRAPHRSIGRTDTMVERRIAGPVRTARLVHAGMCALRDHQRDSGRRARRVAIAIGAVRQQGHGSEALRDNSVLLRLRDTELMDLGAVTQALRTASIQTPPTATTPRVWSPGADRLITVGLRLLQRRLGSSLLVSHLGEVEAPDFEALAFHPVTAGGSGLSLGAVGHAGRTVLTMRARAGDWDAPMLGQLLDRVILHLDDRSTGETP